MSAGRELPDRTLQSPIRTGLHSLLWSWGWLRILRDAAGGKDICSQNIARHSSSLCNAVSLYLLSFILAAEAQNLAVALGLAATARVDGRHPDLCAE